MNNQTTEVKEQAKVRKNMERFISMTGKSEEDYKTWATQVGRKMHINTLDKLVCAKLEIYSIGHLIHLNTELPWGIPEKEADAYLLEHSVNPLELAQLWQKEKANVDAWIDKQSIIDMFLKPFPKTNFERFGDKNWLTDVSRSWFSKEGLSIDVQVQEMNTVFGFDITIDDVIDFVRTYRRNQYRSVAQKLVESIEIRWKELTTFQLKDYYIEHLLKANYFEPTIEEIEVPF